MSKKTFFNGTHQCLHFFVFQPKKGWSLRVEKEMAWRIIKLFDLRFFSFIRGNSGTISNDEIACNRKRMSPTAERQCQPSLISFGIQMAKKIKSIFLLLPLFICSLLWLFKINIVNKWLNWKSTEWILEKSFRTIVLRALFSNFLYTTNVDVFSLLNLFKWKMYEHT